MNKIIWRTIRKQAKSKGEKYAKLYIHSLSDSLKNRQIQKKKNSRKMKTEMLLVDPEIPPGSSALEVDSLLSEPSQKPVDTHYYV